MSVERLDPVLARVLGRSFESICSEMGSAMIRTAISAVFVEGRDFSCAILDDRAELVAAANFDPSHLSAMALTGEYAMMDLGWDDLDEGDVLIVNDPYRGGGHLPDICVVRPIFAEGELLGLAMNRGHHIDVGGMSVAGFPGTARSIHQEGVRIPPVKWFEGGKERRQVMDLILLNVRFPREQLGDFRGQLASCITAEQRIRDLVERYGLDTIKRAMQETKDHSETLMREAIRDIADGDYAFQDVMDDDGVGGGPYLIDVKLNVREDEVTVDFGGSSGQASGPVNSSYGNTVGSVFNAFMHTFGSDIPFNHGSFRPIGFEIPRGCFLNPIPPAPVFGGGTETSIRIIDAVFGALAKAAPDRVAAGCYGTCINVAGGGWDDDRDQQFGVYFFQEGGWGATAWRDGWTSVPNPTSNFNDYPAEVVESTLPLRCVEFTLNEDSGGPGRYRGGLGTRRTYEILADECDVNALGDRFLVPPHGLEGGMPGMKARLLYGKAGSGEQVPFNEAFELASPSKMASVHMERGDTFSMRTGGGGGYGNPFDREPQAVLDDVREGLVSTGQAVDAYGVIVRAEADGPVLDEEATLERRRTKPVIESQGDFGVTVPAGVSGGQPVEEMRRVERLSSRVLAKVGPDPCETRCPLAGDPVRCPYHHPFALQFWDAQSLEGWSSRHCLIASERAEERSR